MQKLISIIFILLLSSSAYAAETFSFRNIELGMSEAEVRAFETGKLLQAKKILMYAIKDMYDLEGYCEYIFDPSDKVSVIVAFLTVPPTVDVNTKYTEIKTDFLEKYKNSIDLSKLKDDGNVISFEIETLFKPNIFAILAITKEDGVDMVGFTFMASL